MASDAEQDAAPDQGAPRAAKKARSNDSGTPAPAPASVAAPAPAASKPIVKTFHRPLAKHAASLPLRGAPPQPSTWQALVGDAEGNAASAAARTPHTALQQQQQLLRPGVETATVRHARAAAPQRRPLRRRPSFDDVDNEQLLEEEDEGDGDDDEEQEEDEGEDEGEETEGKAPAAEEAGGRGNGGNGDDNDASKLIELVEDEGEGDSHHQMIRPLGPEPPLPVRHAHATARLGLTAQPCRQLRQSSIGEFGFHTAAQRRGGAPGAPGGALRQGVAPAGGSLFARDAARMQAETMRRREVRGGAPLQLTRVLGGEERDGQGEHARSSLRGLLVPSPSSPSSWRPPRPPRPQRSRVACPESCCAV